MRAADKAARIWSIGKLRPFAFALVKGVSASLSGAGKPWILANCLARSGRSRPPEKAVSARLCLHRAHNAHGEIGKLGRQFDAAFIELYPVSKSGCFLAGHRRLKCDPSGILKSEAYTSKHI